MRERTTWNRESVTAAMSRTADPYAMNQDHLQQQPKADKYLTGDPSTFAEDVTEPNTWDREYAGGATQRDEIGLPDFRPETFNHAERSASAMDEKTLIKKADLCTTVARMILRGRKFANEAAHTEAVESQAVSLMYMPNADLINTASRLASQEEFPGGETWPSTFAGEQQQQQQGAQQQQQQASKFQQAAQQCMQAFQQGDQQGVQAAIAQMVQDQVQQQQKAAAKRAAEEGQDQQGQGQQQQQAQVQPVAQQEGQQQGQGQQQQQSAMDEQALEQMLSQAVQQQGVQAADYDSHKGPAINPPGYGPYNGPQAGGAKTEKSAKRADDQGQQGQGQGQQQQQAGQGQQSPVQQQNQIQEQGQGQGQQQAGGQQQVQMQADDQLLDDMLMGPQGAGGMSEVDIEMEPAQMDTGEIVLSATDDEVLKTLFANDETENAAQAQAIQQGGAPKQAMTRTASTRTVGTRPSGGVSKVGGAPSGGRSGRDVDSLTSLWPSAPDVREAFNMR